MPRKTRSASTCASAANPAVDFVNSLCHTGDFFGVPFRLRPWQERIVRTIFDERGKPRYRKVFIALPRKQGKTELTAAILLFVLFGTGKRGQRIFSASGDRNQAALIFGAASSMIRQSRSLSECSLVFDGYKRIKLEPLDSTYEALSSDAPRKHGLRPSVVLLDEVHVLPNRDLFTALMTAFGATFDPLTIMITTAGHDRTSVCYEQWQYAVGVRDGRIQDPSFLPIIYAADPGDDWTSEETWRKAMPALGDFCQLDFIRGECKQAQELPAYQNTFRQLYLNQWTEQATRWLQLTQWDACNGPVDRMALRGQPCYGGLDLGVTGDLSAYVLAFPDGSGGWSLLPHFWAPRDGKWRRESRNRDRYELWAKQGFLTLTPGNATDHQRIEDDILALNESYPLRKLCADRAYATQLLSRLHNLHALPVEGISQGPVTMNEPTRRFEELLVSGKVRHGGNPVLGWNVANAVVRRNSTGLMHLDKESATERIDGLAATLNALAAANGCTDNEPSVYESRGLLFL
jgi:phage terminase large subunit-like protein